MLNKCVRPFWAEWSLKNFFQSFPPPPAFRFASINHENPFLDNLDGLPYLSSFYHALSIVWSYVDPFHVDNKYPQVILVGRTLRLLVLHYPPTREVVSHAVSIRTSVWRTRDFLSTKPSRTCPTSAVHHCPPSRPRLQFKFSPPSPLRQSFGRLHMRFLAFSGTSPPFSNFSRTNPYPLSMASPLTRPSVKGRPPLLHWSRPQRRIEPSTCPCAPLCCFLPVTVGPSPPLGCRDSLSLWVSEAPDIRDALCTDATPFPFLWDMSPGSPCSDQ